MSFEVAVYPANIGLSEGTVSQITKTLQANGLEPGLSFGRPVCEAVSVFIMTLNEEANIRRCLEALMWSDDVVVLDSHSNDKTVEIAKTFPNVRVAIREFDDYSGQRNFGLHNIAYKHPWVLLVDADEVVDPALATEIRALVSGPTAFDVYLLRRKVFFGGHWIRRTVSSNVWIPRLVRPTSVRYIGTVHETLIFDGQAGLLMGRLEHHQFDKGIDNWLERRAQYAQLENATPRSIARFGISDLCGKDMLRRRAAQKRVFYLIPARWLWYCVYNLTIHHTYLDGNHGLRRRPKIADSEFAILLASAV